MKDPELIRAIADAIATDLVARNWPSLREELVDTNIRMVSRTGWGDVMPEKLAAIALQTLRDQGVLPPPE